MSTVVIILPTHRRPHTIACSIASLDVVTVLRRQIADFTRFALRSGPKFVRFWLDPALGLTWPVRHARLSPRDAALPSMREVAKRILPWAAG